MKTLRYLSALLMLSLSTSAGAMLCGFPTGWALPHPTCGAPVIYITCHRTINGPTRGGELIYNRFDNQVQVLTWQNDFQLHEVLQTYRRDDRVCKEFGR